MATKDLRWSGLVQQMSPSMTVLSKDQKQVLINAAFEILERSGNRVGSKEALEIFRNAGCRIEPLDDEGEKVFFPQSLIEECLRRAPKRLLLYDRKGEPTLYCEGRNSYFSPTSACPKMYDPYTGERRPWKKEDIGNASKITDALPNLDAMFALGSLADDYGFDCFVHEVHAMMVNTTKPIIYLSNDVPDTKAICEMAAVIAGGWDNLRERPFILQYDEVLSPLKHKNHAFDKFMYLAGERPTGSLWRLHYVGRVIAGHPARRRGPVPCRGPGRSHGLPAQATGRALRDGNSARHYGPEVRNTVVRGAGVSPLSRDLHRAVPRA